MKRLTFTWRGVPSQARSYHESVKQTEAKKAEKKVSEARKEKMAQFFGKSPVSVTDSEKWSRQYFAEVL